MKPVRLSSLLAAAVIAALALFLSNGESVQGTPQTGPTFDAQLCAITFPPPFSGPPNDCADNLTAGANPDLSTWFEVPSPDYYFANYATFTPPGSATGYGPDSPEGAIVGKVRQWSTLGLPGAPCSPDGNTGVDWVLMNGTIDDSDGNLVFPLDLAAAGSQGPLEPMREDDDGDGVPNHSDLYPSYIKSLLDPDRVGDINADGDEFDTISGVPENPGATGADLDGTVDAIQPFARYSASVRIVGTARVLHVLVFPPGGLSGFYSHAGQPGNNGMYPNPLADFGNPSLGWTALVIDDNPTLGPDPTAPNAPSPVHDICTRYADYSLLWGLTRDNPCTSQLAPGTAKGGSTTTIEDTGAFAGFDPNGLVGEIVRVPALGQQRTITANTADKLTVSPPFSSAVQVGDAYGPPIDCIGGSAVETDFRNSPITVGDDPGPAGACSGVDEGGCGRFLSGNSGNGLLGTGTHLFSSYMYTRRDADDDGYESAIDTCPWQTNVEDVRATTGPDVPAGDKLDSVCDPAPSGASSRNTNQDGDDQAGPSTAEWLNADDNCPLTANDDQFEAENVTQLYIAAPDGGPRTDDIGDACDGVVSAENPSGLGDPAVANGVWHSFFTPVPKCIGSTDTDSDGWCDATETLLGANSPPEHWALTFPFPITQRGAGSGMEGQPFQVCNDGIDNDADTDVDGDDGGCFGVDTDGDGWSGEDEKHVFSAVGTANDQDPCGTNGWPPDIIDGIITPNGADIQDLTDYIVPNRYFGTNIADWVGTETVAQRHDVSPGPGFPGSTDIDILDLTLFIVTKPPMLGGDRVFGSVCPWPG